MRGVHSFKWFLPTDERAGYLSAPESEIVTSDSDSGFYRISLDSSTDRDDESTVVTPSGGRSDETYGGLSHRSVPAIASGT